ncbi:MAG TPA: J domain-containing protein [Acidimicrobiia bacterium]|nr:J domain-containing protein [Acidimicrobiia bacterium]
MRDPRDPKRLAPPISGGHPLPSAPRAVLGLPVDATRGEAQRAFRRLAKQTHPDAGGNAADFRAVAGAWAELARMLPPGQPKLCVSSPHVRAYEVSRSRVVWSEPRRTVSSTVDFNAVMQGAMARRAA